MQVLSNGDVLSYGIARVKWGSTPTLISAEDALNYSKGKDSSVSLLKKEEEGTFPAFYLFLSEGNVTTTLKQICCYGDVKNMAVLGNGNHGDEERVVVSCFHCAKIYLFDISREKLTKAFEDKEFIPGPLCSDGKKTLYCMNMASEGKSFVYELDCTNIPFRLANRIQTGMENIHSICYSPPMVPSIGSSGQIVVTSIGKQIVKGISCKVNAGNPWEFQAKQGDKTLNPHGLCSNKRTHLVVDTKTNPGLIVADGRKDRLILLTSGGEFIEYLQVAALGGVADVQMHNNHLVLLCRDWVDSNDNYKICFATLEVRINSSLHTWTMFETFVVFLVYPHSSASLACSTYTQRSEKLQVDFMLVQQEYVSVSI